VGWTNKINNCIKCREKIESDIIELYDKDFYPPEDTRYYKSNINDIVGGDNFADYAEWFFNCYADEIFDF
jgi:hypothetical protein